MQRRTLRIIMTLAAATVCLAPRISHADLDGYVKKPEPAFRWEKRGEQKRTAARSTTSTSSPRSGRGSPGSTASSLPPRQVEHPGFCTLYNTGGSGSDGNTALGVTMAKASGAVYAILYNIPNQPLFDGKTEDALIVHTWLKYLETGTRLAAALPDGEGVLKAMDAHPGVHARRPACRRRPASWSPAAPSAAGPRLAGASRDRRIKAIAPMVIDILNVPKQSPHKLQAYGKPSEQIGEYTAREFRRSSKLPRGASWWNWRTRTATVSGLTLPKLIILGTNDRYWTQDALNLYWDGCRAPSGSSMSPTAATGWRTASASTPP